MALRSTPSPEPYDLKATLEDSFDATGKTSSLVNEDQDRMETLRLKIKSLGINGSDSDEDEEGKLQDANIKANQSSQPNPQAPLGRSKGGFPDKSGFTLVSQHAEMLLLGKKYFIVFPNVYCFETNRIICRVDSRSRYHEADLKPNPPERETCFYIEGMPYWFDGSNQLWYNIGGEWLPEVLHDDLAQARTELTHSAVNSRIDPMAGASTAASSSAGRYGATTNHNSEDEDVYPDYPLSPHPGQEEIDSWFEEFKSMRNALFKTRDRLSDIRCPVEGCRKTQRRPQALRDHLYFHFGIKPYECDYKCSISFETEANKNRHLETCSFRPPTRR